MALSSRPGQCRYCHKIVCERLQKCDNVTLLLARESKVTDQLGYVGGRLRRRPATYFLARRKLSTAGQRLRRVVEVHHLAQTVQVPVVDVSFHEVQAGSHIDITQCGYLELPVVERREVAPLQRVRVVRTAQHGSHSQVGECQALRIGDVSELVRSRLTVIWKRKVPRNTDVGRREIGEERRQIGGAEARRVDGVSTEVALVALRFAIEQVVTALLTGGQLCVPGKPGIELRRKRTHVRRGFVRGHRQCQVVIGGVRGSPILRTQVDRERGVGGRWTRRRANRGHVGGPVNRERLNSVDQFDERPVASPRYLPDDARRIGIAYLYRIDRRSLSLFRSGICKADSGRPHIPEIASVEVGHRLVVVENGSEGGVSVALGLSGTETNIRFR